PFIVRPCGPCMTAAPRPMVAIVPLSKYLNGSVFLPSTSRAMFSPAWCPDSSATDPSWKDRVRFAISDPGDIPDREHLRVPSDAEIRPYGDPVPPLQLQPKRPDDGVRLQPRAPH